jgi:dihydrofolate reductase
MLSIIVAQDKNRAIGKDNEIPWRLRNDRRRFKSLVVGRVVIQGRKSHESLAAYYKKSGRALPAKTYIVVTRQPNYKAMFDNSLIAGSLKEAIKIAKSLSGEVFVIGGAQIYEQALPLADRLYITEVDAEIEGDTFFPVISSKEWIEVARESYRKDENHAYDYDYVMFDRIKK